MYMETAQYLPKEMPPTNTCRHTTERRSRVVFWCSACEARAHFDRQLVKVMNVHAVKPAVSVAVVVAHNSFFNDRILNESCSRHLSLLIQRWLCPRICIH